MLFTQRHETGRAALLPAPAKSLNGFVEGLVSQNGTSGSISRQDCSSVGASAFGEISAWLGQIVVFQIAALLDGVHYKSVLG